MEETQVRRYQPKAEQGLSSQEVAARVQEGLVNFDASVPTKTIGRIIRDNVCTLFNLLNALLALAVLLVGSHKNLLFIGVVVCNTIIGTVQEIRAKRTVDKLSLLSAAKAHVVRDGTVQAVDVNGVVLDDVLEFANGNQIVVDCVLLDGECDVNESLVTGESDSIHKRPGDMLLSGSYVVSGRCRARVEHIGDDNYVSKISNGAKYLKKANSEIMNALNKIIKVVSILIVPVGAVLFARQLQVEDTTFQQAVVSTVAALIGMIPEGLVLLTSTVLAVGVIRLSYHKVLVQELYCIEALARVDVLCLDKTGTITEGTMELKGVLALDAQQEDVEQALRALTAVMQDTSPTFAAIEARYHGRTDWQVQEVVPFSSERKWSGAAFEQQGSFVIGAPEFVFRNQAQQLEQLQPQVEKYAQTHRVLVLARSDAAFADQALPSGLTPMALILIQDKIRDEAGDTLRYFAQQGVELKVISGDNVQTVSGIARRAGLANAERAVDATTLQTEEDIDAAVSQYTVFGRVTPQQKRQMVLSLKKQGHTVAMTGDGVNDVLALKEADCSVAMASGSDAARNVSQLVLLDSNFASMPRVVAEGRRSINNIQRSASLFLVKTIYATILAVLFVFISMPYPFMPIQLTLVSTMTIGIPSFILALEPNNERIRGNFLRNIISKAVPGAVTIVVNILLINLLAYLTDMPYEESSTLCVIMNGFTGLMLVFRLCLPFNWIRSLLFGTITCGLVVGVVFCRPIFSLAPLHPQLLIYLACFMVFAFLLFNLMLFIFDKHLLREDRFTDTKGETAQKHP